MEQFGKIPCGPLEEVWVSVQEVQGKAQLELQVHRIPTTGAAATRPQGDAIRIPVDQLLPLLQVLNHVREICANRGYLSEPASAGTPEQGEPAAPPILPRTPSGRQHPRMPVKLPVECRVVDAERFWPTPLVAGELHDISLGGAQAWLPKRLPRFRKVDIAGELDGKPFQARATIVSVGLESQQDPVTCFHRHGLQWVAMEPRSHELLVAALAQLSEGGRTEGSGPGEPQPCEPEASALRQDPSLSTRWAPERSEGGSDQGQARAGTAPTAIRERRQAPRFALPQPLSVRARVGGAREVWLLDLSLTGARIEHEARLQPGTSCALGFPAASSPLVLEARVVRSVPLRKARGSKGTGALRYTTGLAFVDVTPEKQAMLRRIVEWVALGGEPKAY